MIKYPYSLAASSNFNYSQLFEQEANDLADVFLKHSAKDAVLIFQTGHWGARSFHGNCYEHPLIDPPPPEDFNGYHWSQIPVLNSYYKTILKQRISSDRLVILDTAEMLAARIGCRVDYVHFTHSRFPFSPNWRIWQLLQNVLTSFHSSR